MCPYNPITFDLILWVLEAPNSQPVRKMENSWPVMIIDAMINHQLLDGSISWSDIMISINLAIVISILDHKALPHRRPLLDRLQSLTISPSAIVRHTTKPYNLTSAIVRQTTKPYNLTDSIEKSKYKIHISRKKKKNWHIFFLIWVFEIGEDGS